MTKDECPWRVLESNDGIAPSSFRHSCFELLSDFRRLFSLGLLTCVAAASGCRGTPIDVAKGRPMDGDANFISSDYEAPKEPEGWERFAPENIYKTTKKAFGYGPNQKIAFDAFDEGVKLYQDKKYDAAAKQFGKSADRWPDSVMEEDSMFMQAECYFFADRYSSANDQYGELLKKYPNTRHLDASISRQFSIARYWQENDRAHHHMPLVANFTDRTRPMFDTGGHAINAFDNVRVNDPRGPLADSAVMAVAQQYFLQGRYEDADYYFGLLRSDYPKSKYQYPAHLLGIQCKLQKYQGPHYNGKPLEEADQLIDQTLVQFPADLKGGDERDRLVTAKAEIKAQKATRDIRLAEYYENGEHFGAAKIYYAQVMKDYPQTQFAERAKTRLAEIDGKPDNPPNRLAFITDWLEPEDKRDTVKR
jgi:TolA-binding protein